MGFFTILGFAVRNSMTLVSRYRQLESEEDETFGAALVGRATQERAAPILMSSLVTALVFLPFALAGSIPGLEFAHPMALIVLGGLTTATPLALVGVPALYLLFGAAREPDLGLEEYAHPVKVVVGKEVTVA
jgi:Cu/Ag efflux pump CusA